MYRSAQSAPGRDRRFDEEKAPAQVCASGRPRAAAYYNLFTYGPAVQSLATTSEKNNVCNYLTK